MRYLKLRHVGNAVECLNELRGKGIMLAIYHMDEGHLECASEPLHPREMEAKYAIPSAERSSMKRDCRGSHALLAYDFSNGTVSVLDSFPDLQVASAALIAMFNAAIGTASVGAPRFERPMPEYNPIREDIPHYECGGHAPIADIENDPLSGLNGLGGLFGHV